MKVATMVEPTQILALKAETAADLMTASPVSLRETATLHEALALLVDKGYSAAPVIDHAGRPVGVLSRSDLLIHERENPPHLREAGVYDPKEMHTDEGEPLGKGFQVEDVDPTPIRELMTPAIFCVAPETPARKVIADLLGLNVHRLFVVDDQGVLVGVISAMDVLRHLK